MTGSRTGSPLHGDVQVRTADGLTEAGATGAVTVATGTSMIGQTGGVTVASGDSTSGTAGGIIVSVGSMEGGVNGAIAVRGGSAGSSGEGACTQHRPPPPYEFGMQRSVRAPAAPTLRGYF